MESVPMKDWVVKLSPTAKELVVCPRLAVVPNSNQAVVETPLGLTLAFMTAVFCEIKLAGRVSVNGTAASTLDTKPKLTKTDSKTTKRLK